MKTVDNRQNIRRKEERRTEERRIITHDFGTDEWHQLIQKEYLLWPKKNRRMTERRNLMRREEGRRIQPFKSHVPLKQYQNLLTNEEKDMLATLMKPHSD